MPLTPTLPGNRRIGSHRDIGIDSKSRTAQTAGAPEARHCARHLPVHPSARASDLDAAEAGPLSAQTRQPGQPQAVAQRVEQGDPRIYPQAFGPFVDNQNHVDLVLADLIGPLVAAGIASGWPSTATPAEATAARPRNPRRDRVRAG